MKQWLIRKLIAFMGHFYVWLDRKLEHPKGKILELEIDEDLDNMSRYDLCCHIEEMFDLNRDSFWRLESTQKIRYCAQTARNLRANQKKSRKKKSS